MAKAEENKKLLAQIAELERDSTNFFDVEKEFFLIDSDNLPEVKTRFYGYSIQATGIYEQDNLTEGAVAGLDGRGCYVYVEARDGKITIKQDLNGSWGIYLFRQGDYFALSNSFFRLLDHIKLRYPLTVNRDYCHHLLLNGLCSHAYSETAVNEIQTVERNAILHIDSVKKNLDIELINYKENTLGLDSEEGMSTLDNWVELWCSILRGIYKNTNLITADLSGGFDTRIPFALLLCSGIDCNKIRLNSYTDALHTHSEDYKIANQIANHYGFKLNQPLPPRQYLNYSLSDLWNIDLYHRQVFEKTPAMFSTKKAVKKVYCLSGYAGETIRGNWLRFESVEDWRQSQIERANSYSLALCDELANSMAKVLDTAFSIVRDKYKIEDPKSLYVLQYLYQETRCRVHFGKYSLGNYFRNSLRLSPALDPKVRTLKFDASRCRDPKLLMAVLFTRYAPDLLKFRFEGNRSIEPATIDYARKLNKRLPRSSNKVKRSETFNLQPFDLNAERIIAEGRNNKDIPRGVPEGCLKAMFDSRKSYGLFSAYFNEELYKHAAAYYKKHDFGSYHPLYSVVGIVKVLENVEISNRNRPLYRDMQRFIEQDFATIHKGTNEILRRLSPYITARIDVKFIPKVNEDDLQILDVSDNEAKVSKPAWFQKNGIGYIITSSIGNLEFTARADKDGQLSLSFKGRDIRDSTDRLKRIPYWIDYTKLTISGETIFDTVTPTWHSKPYVYNMYVKAGEEITVQVEWLPHHSD